MVAVDLIEPAKSEWKAPIVFEPKRVGTFRFLRGLLQAERSSHSGLLSHTVHGRMHHISWKCHDFLDTGSQYLLLPTGGRQQRLRQNRLCASPRTIPFYSNAIWPKNTPRSFQPAMDIIMSLDRWQFALVNIDEMVIFSYFLRSHTNIMTTYNNACCY